MRFRLIPTDDAFFGLFNESAANVAECALRWRVSEGYAWVAATIGVVYVIFAVGSWLDARGHREI